MTITSHGIRNRDGLRRAIELELTGLFHARTSAAAAYESSFVRLWTLAGESVLGGKFVRPLLLVETYDSLRGEGAAPSESTDRSTVIEIAAAIELLHYAFLLHDDVIDGDLTRRGRPNLIGALLEDVGVRAMPAGQALRERERLDAGLHWARTGGILMGNLLLSSTHQTFARARLPHEVRVRLLDLLDHTIAESVAGEQLDVGLGDGIVTPDLGTILTMCAHKTATYTFELPLRAAAVLAGAGPRLESTLAAAGRHLGLAFQLQDDLLGTFGDPRIHGKDAFSDLREGKQTALIAYARMTSAWPSIEPFFGSATLTESDAARMRDLLSQCGAEQFVQGLVDEQLHSLYDLLVTASSEIPGGVRQVLLELSSELEGRRS